MVKFTVGISGGGIAGLCLAAELVKNKDIRVDLYEASDKIEEIGANVTLWGRVCEVLRLMGLENECIKASAAVASSSDLPRGNEYRLRGFRQPDEDFGILPFEDAWSLRRADLIRILLRRVPAKNIRLGKKLWDYVQGDTSVQLRFSDGSCATCDVLIGADGIRSVTRAKMMRREVEITGQRAFARYIEPRWSGTVAYRSLVPSARLAAKNPRHKLLSGGQIYLGKNQHIIGYPVSKSMLNIAVSVTDISKENTRWPSPSWSTGIDKRACKSKIAQRFTDWDAEALDIVETIDSSIEWGVMDIEPLPFYVKGHVALIGDAAHAAVPYVGASAAFALEDAYVLARILCSEETTRRSLKHALEAYQIVRRPHGNKFVANARCALREFQYNGPHGGNMARIKEAMCRIFEESTGTGRSSPEADGDKAVLWMQVQERAYGPR